MMKISTEMNLFNELNKHGVGMFQNKNVVLSIHELPSEDKSVSWPSYHYNRTLYNGKTVFILGRGPGREPFLQSIERTLFAHWPHYSDSACVHEHVIHPNFAFRKHYNCNAIGVLISVSTTILVNMWPAATRTPYYLLHSHVIEPILLSEDRH